MSILLDTVKYGFGKRATARHAWRDGFAGICIAAWILLNAATATALGEPGCDSAASDAEIASDICPTAAPMTDAVEGWFTVIQVRMRAAAPAATLNVACTTNADCDDAVFCNGEEPCDVDGICQPGVTPMCDDGVGCTADGCNAASDECVHFPFDPICDDTLACNGVEICSALFDCLEGAPLDCDDGVACTADSCDEATFGCEHLVDDTVCDDDQLCNGAESCDAQLDCQPGVAPAVGDGVACTTDSCDEDIDAVVHAPDDAACDDGSFCTGAETCDATLGCQVGAPPDCDDRIACTVDSCNADLSACTHVTDDAFCDDGQFCNGLELCNALTDCEPGTAPPVDDGIACTADGCNEISDTIVHTASDAACDDDMACNGIETCDPQVGCVAGAGLDCDDGIACTADSCDDAQGCLHTPVDAVCKDDMFCNGVEFCDPTFGCLAGTLADCSDGIECTIDECEEIADECIHTSDDPVCDNGTFCDGSESCDALLGCSLGSLPSCDDGVACTADSCDSLSDACAHSPGDASCDDGQFCNGVEACVLVVGCASGVAPSQDDGVGCTLDSCDESSDTILHSANDLSCDDGLFCNGSETCDAELDCQPGTPPAGSDGVACTVDSCDESIDAFLHTPDDTACNDDLSCNGAETCDAEQGCLAGQPPDCDDAIACTLDACNEDIDACSHALNDDLCHDGNQCTDEQCVTGQGCVSTPNSSPCDDGNECTSNDQCAQGVCAGVGMTCDDGNPCTTDSCDLVAGCGHTPNALACDDANACTVGDVCSGGACTGGAPLECGDGNPCTTDSCVLVNGCGHAPNALACDDGNACTTGDVCSGGSCTGGSSFNCDDNNPCTTDTCDLASGCAHTPNALACDDTNACTVGDVCSGGACTGGSPLDCADANPCTTDACNTEVGCTHDPNSLLCNDGNACTAGDVCSAGTCTAGSALDCSDSNACTADSCDAGAGCQHTTQVCDDADPCTVDNCNPALGCDSTPLDCSLLDTECEHGICDPTSGVCVAEPCEECCDDSNACTADEHQQDGSCTHEPVDCDDLDACTLDTCDQVSGCAHATVNCDDGVSCTLDACSPASGCTHAGSDAFCDDGLFCNGAEVCDVQSGCSPGVPVPCNDGDTCTMDTCDETTDDCRFDPQPDPAPGCGGNVCTPAGSIDIIDFESFAEGAIVQSASTGGGLGPIAVTGTNPRFPATNTAVIFDSSCPGGCSGGDSDLGTPSLSYGGPGVGHVSGCGTACANDRPYGKILIVDEHMTDLDDDGLVDDPDDQGDEPVSFEFDFAAIDPVTIHHVVFIDIEASETAPTVELFDADGLLLGSFAVIPCGDNGLVLLDLPDVSGVSRMRINLYGSGAVAEIALSAEDCPE